MTTYVQKLQEIRRESFSNEVQLSLALNAKNYLDNHYDQDINLRSLAHIQLTSPYHLIRIFKQYFGITPRQFLIDKRIQQAKIALKNGKSVSEACYDVGFQSVQSFSRLFKEKTGGTPSSYRKAIFDK